MRFIRLLYITGWILLTTLVVQAQNDTISYLPKVKIQAPALREEFAGDRVASWDSSQLAVYRGVHIGELLAQETGVFVKSYGNGSLATTSIRGGSAGHTQVVWNGIPLRSPMLGQLDFSLIPVSFIDELQLSYGGNTSAWGSGAIGGIIQLNNRRKQIQGLKAGIETQVGSFGLWNQLATVNWGNSDVTASIRLFHQQALNDFSFQLSPDREPQRQRHASILQHGAMQELYWTVNPQNRLSLHTWLQKADREIPPTTVQNRSEAQQIDEFIRSSLQWEHLGDQYIMTGKVGYAHESLDYMNPLAGVNSQSQFETITGEWNWQQYLREQQFLHVGLTHAWMKARSDGYGTTRSQHLSALFASLKRTIGTWNLQVNVRQELVDGKRVPWVANIGLKGKLTPAISIQAKLSRNYRIPTLNDLYWKPGGNSNLKPEHGWSQELTLQFAGTPGTFFHSYTITGFNRNIHDWILWAMLEGDNFWSAHNLTKVWSRGIEQRACLQKQFPGILGKIRAGYDLIWSTNEIEISSPDLGAGEQLVYVPKQQAFLTLSLKHKSWKASYRHAFRGEVGTLNKNILPSYHLGALNLSYDLKYLPVNMDIFFRINNLWDQHYRVIEYRAMPRRNFLAGISLYTNSKN